MKHEIIAYAGGRRLHEMRPEDVKSFTGINIAFGYCHDDATLDTDHLPPLDCVAEFKKLNPGLKVFISLGGATSGGWSNACVTKAGRERLIESTMAYVRKWGLDGVDLDWEFPAFPLKKEARPEDKYTYTMLCEGFRARMDEYGAQDGKRYWLTMASGADIYMLESIEVKRIGEILDYIQLMTYDMRHQVKFIQDGKYTVYKSGHHTNLYPSAGDPWGVSIERSVELFRAFGIPDDKLVIGAAHYAKYWANAGSENHGLLQDCESREQAICGYGKLKDEYINKNGYVRYWDDDAKAPYLSNGVDFITYDDPESLREKVKYVKEQGLLGIMFWEYFSDSSCELAPVYAQAMNE